MTDDSEEQSERSGWYVWLVCGIFAVHIMSMLILARHAPLTSDENHYLAAGMALREEFRFTPTHTILQGPLVYYANQLAALFGAEYDFPYELTTRNRIQGRIGMIVFTAIALLSLLRLAWKYLGPRAAVAAGVCWSLNPLVLAHGPLMTADMALTAGFLLTITAGIHYLSKPGWRRAIPLGLCVGVAFATKYIALILLPALGVAALFGLLWRRDEPRLGRRALITLYDGAVCGAFALVALHACYGFQGGFYDPTQTSPDPGGALYQIPGMTDVARLLPDPYVRGVDFQMKAGRGFGSVKYLGEISGARSSYYVVALATKLPLAFLLLLVASLLSLGRAYRGPAKHRGAVTVMMLSCLTITFYYVSFLAKLQIGVRYVLPLIPILVFFAVRPVHALWGILPGKIILTVLALWCATVTFFDWPHYISSFNPMAGTRPYMLFGDSTSAWQLVPSRDPAIRELKSRYPRAERVHMQSGPRFGGIILYALDVWPQYELKPGPINHWLRDLEPADREGPFYYFVVTENHFRLGMHSSDPSVAARSRRDLAIALLAEEKMMEVDAILKDGDDIPEVRKQLELLRARPRDNRAIIAGWRNLGRFDMILEDPRATPSDVGKAHFSRSEYKECRSVLEAEMRDRQLTHEELIVLCWAQIRDRKIKRAIETFKRHPPPLGTPAFVRYQEEMAALQEKWREYEVLMEQIGGKIPY